MQISWTPKGMGKKRKDVNAITADKILCVGEKLAHNLRFLHYKHVNYSTKLFSSNERAKKN